LPPTFVTHDSYGLHKRLQKQESDKDKSLATTGSELVPSCKTADVKAASRRWLRFSVARVLSWSTVANKRKKEGVQQKKKKKETRSKTPGKKFQQNGYLTKINVFKSL